MFSQSFLDAVAEEWDAPLGESDEVQIGPQETDNKVHLSLDLSEATYNIPFDVIDAQTDLIDQILADFEPWKVFRKLFRIHSRAVDMRDLAQQGYWGGDESVISLNGTFMGDPLSFIHLSMYLRGAVYSTAAEGYKPIGQSVGDDLLLLGISSSMAKRFNSHIVRTGGKTSKFNAESKNAMTFCEAFAYTPSDRGKHGAYAKDSVFGDLYFLDIIKGSILSGKSKVSVTGSDPFFGHSRMLNKQTDYHPIKWVSHRAGKLLWVANYDSCVKLNSSNASLPESLGGINLQCGTKVSWEDPTFQQYYLPYLAGILKANDVGFYTFSTLLRGIYKANPKGVEYENSLEKLERIFGTIRTEKVRNINALLPDYLRKARMSERFSYISKALHMVSLSHVADELARREAFQLFWEERANKAPFMTLPLRGVRRRHHEVWGEIRKSIQPAEDANQHFKSIEELAKAFEDRQWNVYLNKEDATLKEVFGGMPTLFVEY